jgi:hypothetical protein
MDRPRHSSLAAQLFGGRAEHRLALLRAVWPAAVGDELARRTEVVALDGGVLRIKVPDLRWQRQLLRMRGRILFQLGRAAGSVAPSRLGFVTGPVAEPPPLPPTVPARLPAEAPRLVAEAAAAIPDLELRERFLASAALYLDRFAGEEKDGTPGG